MLYDTIFVRYSIVAISISMNGCISQCIFMNAFEFMCLIILLSIFLIICSPCQFLFSSFILLFFRFSNLQHKRIFLILFIDNIASHFYFNFIIFIKFLITFMLQLIFVTLKFSAICTFQMHTLFFV